MCSFFSFFFFLPDRPTHLHEREGDGKRNILLGWPRKNLHLYWRLLQMSKIGSGLPWFLTQYHHVGIDESEGVNYHLNEWFKTIQNKQTISIKRLTVVSSTRRFANVLLANFWSRFAYVLGQFPNCFRLISSWKKEVYTSVSQFFVSWLVTETKGHISFFFKKWPMFTRTILANACSFRVRVGEHIWHVFIWKVTIWMRENPESSLYPTILVREGLYDP